MSSLELSAAREAAPAAPTAALGRAVVAFVAALTLARLVAVFADGLFTDEAYALTIQRFLALSYFDHPPLHQWIAHAAARAFGETRAVRLPFLALHLATDFGLFGLSRRLFGARAGWCAVFAFNAALYFAVQPEGYILPDPPLLAALSFAGWALAEIFFGPARGAAWLWAGAGLALGLAGLSKYSAAFVPLGALGFLAGSPRNRRWLADPRAYAAAALALALFAPALAWNAEHHWVSFAFQSGRASRPWTLDPSALREVGDGLAVQLGAMGPFAIAALGAGLARAGRGRRDSPERFLLWLALPPLLVFAITPLHGQRPVPHWFNVGWLFAFPLAGLWLSERSARFFRGFGVAAAAIALLAAAGYPLAVALGPSLIPSATPLARQAANYPAAELRAVYVSSGAAFVLVDDWRVGARVGQALGPDAPICAEGSHPHVFAFACDAREHIGQDALIVRLKGHGDRADDPYFARETPLGELAVHPGWPGAGVLNLSAGRNLLRAPELPYGP